MIENDVPSTELELFLPEVSRAITTWTDYEFNSNFLTPTDGFSLTVEDPSLDPVFEDGLIPGAKVELRVAGCTQATGYLDSVERSASRNGGIVWKLEGRDVLGQAVDSTIDPRMQFKETETLADLFRRVFGPFGWSEESQFVIDPDADAEIKTGRKTKKPRPPAKKPRAHKLPQLRPNPGEGAFEFAARVAKRFGMQIWASADGRTLNLGKPYFAQAPNYRLVRRRGGGSLNNILDASAKFDSSEQPSMILAEGFSGGGAFGKSKMRVIIVNPAMIANGDEISNASASFQGAKVIMALGEGNEIVNWAPYPNPRGRPLYLSDQNSKTMEQLEAYARREMMARVRKSLTYHVTVYGHGQTDGGGNFLPWAVDQVVDVQDEIAGVIEPMWILSRTFAKSRSGGTTTKLELIRLYSLEI